MIQHQFTDKPIKYDGLQLSHHWIYKNFDILGNAIVGFIGPCEVIIEHMVDLMDVKNNAPIYSPKMLHFIGEFFDSHLREAVFIQRLLIITIKEELEDRGVPGRIIRKGDDLFHVGIADVKRKLSVSIATSSIVSQLIHVGINIHTEGTPVPTAGLGELGIEPESFAIAVMERFTREIKQIDQARCKVRPVN